jgi:hypothetical protein
MSEGPVRNQQSISHDHFQGKGVDVRELAVRRLQKYMLSQTPPITVTEDSCRFGGKAAPSRLAPFQEMHLQPLAPTIAFGAMAQKEAQLGLQDDPRVAIVAALRLCLSPEAVPTRCLPTPNKKEDTTLHQSMTTLRSVDARDQRCRAASEGHCNVQGLISAAGGQPVGGGGCPVGARCHHVSSWKRIRGKKGFAYYYCLTCFSKWRIPSINLQLNCGLQLKPARSSLPTIQSFSLPIRPPTAKLCDQLQQRQRRQQQQFIPKSWPIQFGYGGCSTSVPLSSKLQCLAWTRA